MKLPNNLEKGDKLPDKGRSEFRDIIRIHIGQETESQDDIQDWDLVKVEVHKFTC